MNSEKIKLTIIGGMFLLVGLVYLIPSKNSRVRQGSSDSVANSIENAAVSVKKSIDSLASSEPIVFGKSNSISKGSMSSGGSKKHFKKVGKRKTRGRQ
jgi:hypothetical protein